MGQKPGLRTGRDLVGLFIGSLKTAHCAIVLSFAQTGFGTTASGAPLAIGTILRQSPVQCNRH